MKTNEIEYIKSLPATQKNLEYLRLKEMETVHLIDNIIYEACHTIGVDLDKLLEVQHQNIELLKVIQETKAKIATNLL